MGNFDNSTYYEVGSDYTLNYVVEVLIWTGGSRAADCYLEEILVATSIEAVLDIEPETINMKSKGKWIACYIELPQAYDVDDVDIRTVKLNETVSAEMHPTQIGDHDVDDIADLMVKFDRLAVQSIVQIGDEIENYGQRAANRRNSIRGHKHD